MSEFKSRFEQYLTHCIEKCGCDGLPAPRSRAEVLLYQLAEELANGGGGGGGGGVSSWNDLKDKPFGEQYAVILPATDIEMVDGAEAGMPGMWIAPLFESIAIKGGETYTVVFNGTPYTLTAIDIIAEEENIALLGNMAFYGGDDTGEPFLLTDSVLITTENAVNLEISGKVFTPIDYKYLTPPPTLRLDGYKTEIQISDSLNIPEDDSNLYKVLKEASVKGLCYIFVSLRNNGIIRFDCTVHLTDGGDRFDIQGMGWDFNNASVFAIAMEYLPKTGRFEVKWSLIK